MALNTTFACSPQGKMPAEFNLETFATGPGFCTKSAKPVVEKIRIMPK
jgi:hypothetical protein